jgi:hypothetical protein
VTGICPRLFTIRKHRTAYGFSDVLPDADIGIYIVEFLFREFPCRQITEQNCQRKTSLFFGLLADRSGDDAFFQHHLRCVYGIVRNNMYIRLFSGSGQCTASSVNAGCREIQGIDLRMLFQKGTGAVIAFYVVIVVINDIRNGNVRVFGLDLCAESGDPLRVAEDAVGTGNDADVHIPVGMIWISPAAIFPLS